MDKIKKYNLEIMSCIFAAFIAYSAFRRSELTMIQQMIAVYMLLYTLHEWEESRFPGGFYRIFFSKVTIDPEVSEEEMHFPVAVYLLIILITPFVLKNVALIAMIPLILALFEGFIHTAGIVIHDLKKPYSPGMITALILFAYSVYMIPRINEEYKAGFGSWILGIILTFVSFFIMETRFMKVAGITIKEFQSAMKAHMKQKFIKR